MPDIQIKTLKSSPNTCATLSEMLVETVANGGSVSFMHPLPFEAANEFWRNSLASADRGERIVLVRLRQGKYHAHSAEHQSKEEGETASSHRKSGYRPFFRRWLLPWQGFLALAMQPSFSTSLASASWPGRSLRQRQSGS